ncbi:polysaccharide biosynthesis PFTS motif protein [Acidobacteria bacterium AH-259-D05]|nr:polysaccharide biosynthesis PFTS motif protein [Acidobacteria bacterium AH-259-D05]
MVSSPSAQSNTRLLLYYHLTASELPGLQLTKGARIDVACLTADVAVRRDAAGAVDFLGTSAVPEFSEVVDPEAVLHVVEIVFKFLVRHSVLLGWIRRQYDSSDIDYYFRRALLTELGALFSVASLAGTPLLAGYTSVLLTPDWPGSRLWLLFLKLRHQAELGPELADHLPQPICTALDRLSVACEPRQGRARRHAWALYNVAGMWYWALRRLRPQAPRLPASRLLIRTYATDFSFNLDEQERLRNVDFVVDGDELHMEDVVIWVEPGTSVERRQALKQRGYRLLSTNDVAFGPVAFIRRMLPLLLSYTALLPRLAREDRWWYPHVAILVHNYLIWQEVCHQLKPVAFLAYNDLSAIGVARNIVLRQHGCRSTFYQHSCNTDFVAGEGWTLNEAYSYLVFDVIATWGADHSDLFRRHPSVIGDCWEVGCLWSEHARNARENPEIRKYYVNRIETRAQVKLSDFQRIIGVFDTSLNSLLSHNEIHRFVAGNVELARKMPDTVFLYKPKNPFAEATPGWPIPLIEAFGPKGKELWKKICSTPNFVVLPNLFETASVVGLADLVISACFTSTTVEAIGCGNRAIYYDPTDRAPHAFWHRIPGMVCIADEELYDRVRYLLWDCDDEMYMNYLSTHCVGIEGHFDGQAITRLRRRLLDVVNDRRSVRGTHG